MLDHSGSLPHNGGQSTCDAGVVVEQPALSKVKEVAPSHPPGGVNSTGAVPPTGTTCPTRLKTMRIRSVRGPAAQYIVPPRVVAWATLKTHAKPATSASWVTGAHARSRWVHMSRGHSGGVVEHSGQVVDARMGENSVAILGVATAASIKNLRLFPEQPKSQLGWCPDLTTTGPLRGTWR